MVGRSKFKFSTYIAISATSLIPQIINALCAESRIGLSYQNSANSRFFQRCRFRYKNPIVASNRHHSAYFSSLKTLFAKSDQSDELLQSKNDHAYRQRQRNFARWGVDDIRSSGIPSSYDEILPICPSTFEEVANDAFLAIAGTICGFQRPDPNAVSNAMHRSVLDYRPTQPACASSRSWVDPDDVQRLKHPIKKSKQIDAARMGVEIDGAAFLFPSMGLVSMDEGRAIRIISLEIAGLLISSPWVGFEESDEEKRDNDSKGEKRSVAIYYNSMDQALMASRELRRIRESHANVEYDEWDSVHICFLGQDSIPFTNIQEKHKRQKKKSTNEQSTQEIILIVKPTDYDVDSKIQGQDPIQLHPKIQPNIIEKLQSLLFKASAANIPAVVISPRLSELPPLQQSSPFSGSPTTSRYRTGPSGFEQSGFQRSATYGGIEPPVGPTPWLLRDLAPPVYVWVGCSWDIINANSRSRKSNRHPSFRSIKEAYQHQQKQQRDDSYGDEGHERLNLKVADGKFTYSYYSRIALTQSAMDAGHAWRMFAVKEKVTQSPYSSPHSMYATYRSKEKRGQSGRNNCFGERGENVVRESEYHYMASSNASYGRPTMDIVQDVFDEWSELNEGDDDGLVGHEMS
mmetsp:Transcript_3876/g.8640  ORF Transcript_3876/g.8640 Transcript_3876/m.8640 type:complete len:630 (+) Transcript_3876:139-2028(+)